MSGYDPKLQQLEYDRKLAVAYAKKWAYERNPRYYDFERIGGDCTNYASQCIFAGTGVMNYKHTFGWYYRTLNDRSPSWTGVEYLHNFLTTNEGLGPYGEVCALSDLMEGDIVQLRFTKGVFEHSPVVVHTGEVPNENNILLAAHSFDTYGRPLSSYLYTELRPIHIIGYRKG